MNVGLTFLTFGKNIFAGMENSAYNFAKGVLRTGNNISVFTSKACGNSKNIDGIRVFHSKILPLKYSSDDDLISFLKQNKESLQEELETFISFYKLDILIAWDPLWGIIQYTDLFKVSPIPSFVVYHFPHSKSILQSSDKYPYRKRYAVSHFLAKDLKELGIISKIDVLPNSIDLDFIGKRIKSIKKSDNLILCNARLSQEKGARYAVRGFAEFSKNHSEYRLQLCSGSFPFGDFKKEKKLIDKEIKILKIRNKVEYLPNLDWKDVPKIIARAKIVVVPTLKETFGIAVLEAMAVGTPIITTKIDNLPDLVGNSALLVRPKSSGEIFNALEKLHQDSNLYNRCLLLAKHRAKKYDIKKVANFFIEGVK